MLTPESGVRGAGHRQQNPPAASVAGRNTHRPAPPASLGWGGTDGRGGRGAGDSGRAAHGHQAVGGRRGWGALQAGLSLRRRVEASVP